MYTVSTLEYRCTEPFGMFYSTDLTVASSPASGRVILQVLYLLFRELPAEVPKHVFHWITLRYLPTSMGV